MSRLALIFPDLLDRLARAPEVPPDTDRRTRLTRPPGWGERRRARVPRL